MRSPKQLIELYWTEVWNNRQPEMIRELCADPIIRHDPGSVTALSIEDQIARVRQQSERAEPFFEHEILHADDTYVTSVWNMHTRKGPRVDLCGIEVFKAENGRFTHCWNSSYVAGRWGREGDKAVPDNLPPPSRIAHADAMTPAWLQSVFQHAGLDMPRVSMVAHQPIGHGNLADTRRAVITYNANAEKAVTSVIAKLTHASSAVLDLAQHYGVYEREAKVYDFFGASPPLPAPRAFFSKAGEGGRSLNLILEDLSTRTRAGDQIKGCSIPEAQSVIDSFARLHAAYWNDAALKNADWLYRRARWADAVEASYPAAATIMRGRLTGRAAPQILDKMDRFSPHAGAMTRAFASGPALVHGEPRVDNILFEDTSAGPIAWLIDWQFADLASPMFDTAYFLSGSLLTADRRTCENALIERHQRAIAAAGHAYTLDDARRDYAAALPFALFTTVGAALAIPAGPHADLLLLTLLERNIEALSDWNQIP